MDTPENITAQPCPMVQLVGILSGKWAIPVLYHLIMSGKPIRFGQLQRAVEPITQKELTKHLREFERRGLVLRTVYAEVPPRVEYRASALALTLEPPLSALAAWMRSHQTEMLLAPVTSAINAASAGNRHIDAA